MNHAKGCLHCHIICVNPARRLLLLGLQIQLVHFTHVQPCLYAGAVHPALYLLEFALAPKSTVHAMQQYCENIMLERPR